MYGATEHAESFQFSDSFNMRRGHFIKAMYSSLVDGIITDPELMVRQIAIGMPGLGLSGPVQDAPQKQ